MAYLSEILSENPGIPPKCKDEASKCLSCGEKIEKGGMWVTQEMHIGICKKCAPVLLDWYIDTLLDTGEIDENDDEESVKRLSNDIISRYYRKKKKKIKYEKEHI